jgi:type 1 glutamine amidotransferase
MTCAAMILLGRVGAGEAKKKKLSVVVITGGHGYDKKVFPKTFEGHEDLEIKIVGTTSKIFDDISDWKYDVMVLFNFKQKINDQQKKNFIALLKEKKVGLVVLHHAIAAYPGWIEYEKIIGATYVLKAQERDGVKYPRPVWKHDVDMKIHVEDREHPITKGMEDFEIHDESYKKWVYHDGNHLLLSTDCELNNKQICWVKKYGDAKVFYMMLGHGPQIFTDENYKKVVARGIRWTGGLLGEK